jgi:hypothetical protein
MLRAFILRKINFHVEGYKSNRTCFSLEILYQISPELIQKASGYNFLTQITPLRALCFVRGAVTILLLFHGNTHYHSFLPEGSLGCVQHQLQK